ncbi:hypothetical protein ABZT08_27305 [Streptomyces sp. NPDC005526]|uniref:hypothetical protein n=1 Tax=unclassified Streptomyces TaxID=2593676 RepID=UPI0033B9D14B
MRRTTLPRTTATVAAAAAALILTGCTTRDGGGSPGSGAASPPSGPVSSSASPSASPPASASGSPSAPPSGPASPPAARCAERAELGAADSGRTLCLKVGGQVRLTLDGTRERPWSPVRTTGGALRAANAGIVILPGDAVAAFDAVAPGTARLTSSRPACATGGGGVSCKGVQEWTVIVRVTRP